MAHRLAAEGADPGTLILAEAQTAGRGRQGKPWSSAPGRGIWLTLIERISDRAAIDVLSLRVGLHMAEALEALTREQFRIKWPNDLYRRDQKLAGILVEARWRGSEPDWIAIGVGLNMVSPSDQPTAIGLEDTPLSRQEVLAAIVPAIRAAAWASGTLTPAELTRFAARDFARGRRVIEPVVGVAAGIDPSGALRITTDTGLVQIQAGSLVFDPAT